MIQSSQVSRTLFLFLLIDLVAKINTIWTDQRVILISLDGFRWDYLDKMKDSLPNLNKFKQSGATVDYVRNVFPTNTFPNHYSIVTGLYPENHGIIDNSMYDPYTGKRFNMDNNETFWWGWTEPIWITNERQGHRSGVLYYPGYDVSFGGLKPYYNTLDLPYGKPFSSASKTMPLYDRIDTLIQWLRKDSKLNFVALYLEQIDAATHDNSPDDNRNEKQRAVAFREIDDALDYLMKSLVLSNLQDSVNIIVIGDHGQVNIDSKNLIDLGKYLNVSTLVETAVGSTTIFMYPKQGALNETRKSLKGIHPKMSVYLKKELPERYHIKKCNRTSPLVLLAAPGWFIDSGFHYLSYPPGPFIRGEHGYSNDFRNMNPGFLAWGPRFKQGIKLQSIETVDLYTLMCHILGLTERKNDGDFRRVKDMLED